MLLEVNALTQSYGDQVVLSSISLCVNENQLCVLSGVAGSGKSVLLQLIAGHQLCIAGEILVDKKPVNPHQKITLVLANYYLHPESTVYENLAYRLYIKGIKRKDIRQRIDTIAKLLDIDQLFSCYPSDLNIFSYIRVVFARTLVQHSQFYLLDLLVASFQDDPWRGFSVAVKKRLARLLTNMQGVLKFSVIYASGVSDDDLLFDYISQQFILKHAELIELEK